MRIQNKIMILFYFFSCALPVMSAGDQAAQDNSMINIVPKPLYAILHEGYFYLTDQIKILYPTSDKDMQSDVDRFAQCLRTATGYRLPVLDGLNMPKSNLISFNHKSEKALGDEGYRIEVRKNGIDIDANSGSGFFYAVQTLLQLLPPEVYSSKIVENIQWQIPCVSITDKPRFQWRGAHLDVSRHFFPKEFIKTYIDILAFHKMNIFHWHLTDDQGWRIEIKKYPKLTEVAAWRVDRESQEWDAREPQHEGEKATYGGFYTQDEIREIVRYAAEKHITIVPEIEMPAHTTAALVAYPQFSCTGGPFTVPPGGLWPITDIFCAGNDSTFEFLQDVLTEVIDLFPGEYIHIGGDEANKAEWKKCPKCQARIKQEGLKNERELQSYFIKRIEKFLISKHRRLIGWDEILEGGLAPEATVMSWRGIIGGIQAARANHDVIMTPSTHCYFDYYQGDDAYEPPAIGGYIPLSKVYTFEPVPADLTPEQSAHILGGQANLWSEFITTPEHAQYMLLPRLAAMAEILWSPKEPRIWKDFATRVEQQLKRYGVLHYNYAKSAYHVDISIQTDSLRKYANVRLFTELGTPGIHYTVDGSEPNIQSTLYTEPIILDKTITIKAAVFKDHLQQGLATEETIGQIDPAKNGLAYCYYEGTWTQLPDFSALTPMQRGIVYDVRIPSIKMAEDHWGLVLSGFMEIQEEGEYSFYIGSDDGSKLLIDGNVIVDNDGQHGKEFETGKVTLGKGKHPIVIQYFDDFGSEDLELLYEGPGIQKQKIPATVLFQH